jgi:uncharacterized membrane protein YcaP (DUF421 family)
MSKSRLYATLGPAYRNDKLQDAGGHRNMVEDFYVGLRNALSLNVDLVTVGQIVVRASVVYLAGVLLVRVGDRRFLGKSAAFDVIFGVVLGSLLGRAIAPSLSVAGAVIGGVVLVGLHWLFALIAFRLDWFGRLVKGDAHTLMQDGTIAWAAMRRNHISEKDLLSALRLNGQLTDPREVGLASLERSGDVSVIPAHRGLRIIEVRVEAGVQTVRVELT